MTLSICFKQVNNPMTTKHNPINSKRNLPKPVIGDVLKRLAAGDSLHSQAQKDCPQVPAHKERPQVPQECPF